MPAFDKAMSEAIKQHSQMVRHANGTRTAMRLFRQAAYRFAKEVIAMREKHHEELLAFVATNGTTIDAWMDDHFGPLEENFMEDRRKLFAAIAEGLSEKDYVAAGVVFMVHKRAKAAAKRAQVDVDAASVSEALSDAEKIEHLSARLEAALTEVRQLRKDLRTALLDNDAKTKLLDRQGKSLGRMGTLINTMKKQAG